MRVLFVLLGLLCLTALCNARALSEDCQGYNESECQAASHCVAVRGEHCKAEMAAPPCSLNFSNSRNEECCSTDAQDTAHIKFLGCEPAGFVCVLQCVRPRNPELASEVYMVWEGCAFDNDQFEDASDSSECYECYETVCPDEAGHRSLVEWLLLLACGFFSLAILSAVVVAAFVLAFYLRMRLRSPDAYQAMEMGVEMQPIEDVRDAAPAAEGSSGQEGVDENGVIQARRLANGNIRIPMADGSVREVTPAAYEKLFLRQQKKRYDQYKKQQELVAARD